jgi:putative hydrolase of HD superfamily
MEMSSRIFKQVEFVAETDKLKGVLRRASPIGLSRRENSAEHSWHAVLAAMLLHEHADEEVNLLRVLQMLAIHDVVEVDVGDVFHYEKAHRTDLAELEDRAAQRIFGILPEDQAQGCLALWREFEARQTPDARFAAAVDRFMAIVVNYHNQGGTWLEYNLAAEQILKGCSGIRRGSETLWDFVEGLVEQGLSKGYIRQRETAVVIE